jgi:gliding motility-associated-like protein
MLVIDCPDPGNQPDLKVRTPGSDAFTDSPDTMVFTSNEEKCYEFQVRDADGAGNLQFRVRPVNFEAEMDGFLSVLSGALRGPGDIFSFEFCFPECPFIADQPQIVDIIAGDDACPLPLLDTIRLVVYIEPPPNSRPSFDTLANTLVYHLNEGSSIDLSLAGSDPDGDSLHFWVISPEGQPDYDFDFNPEFPSPENLKLDFFWKADCKKYDFSDNRNFTFLLLLDDNDFCKIYSPDTLFMDIHVDLPPNSPPVIRTDAIQQPVTLKILDSLVLEIQAQDPDNDPLWVYAVPDQFDLAGNGFTPFNHFAAGGFLVEPFGWKLTCETLNLKNRDEFQITFIAEDMDRCDVAQADSLELIFKALPPDNRAPIINLVNHDAPEIALIAGDSLYILTEGTDADADSVYISILDPSGKLEEAGAVFMSAAGSGRASASIFWQTDCSHLHEGGEPTFFDCRLIIADNKCLVPLADTLDLTISLKNREVDYDDLFIPNVFTPNADGYNEYFTVDDLPEDNCDHAFQSVSIYNRLGKEVFFTQERQFRWYARNVKNGIYFYHIKYSGREYKGYLNVLY